MNIIPLDYSFLLLHMLATFQMINMFKWYIIKKPNHRAFNFLYKIWARHHPLGSHTLLSEKIEDFCYLLFFPPLLAYENPLFSMTSLMIIVLAVWLPDQLFFVYSSSLLLTFITDISYPNILCDILQCTDSNLAGILKGFYVLFLLHIKKKFLE